MATDSRSRDVQGRVVRTSIVVAPGGSTVRAAAAPTARANTVASSPQGTPDMALTPVSASQPMDCDDNHAGPDDGPGLHSTPCPGTRRVAELCAQQGVWRDTVPSTARGGHVFAALAGHERDDTSGGGRHRAGDFNATEALVVTFIVNSGMTHAHAGHLLRLVVVGETVTKTCCRGACTHDCDPQASDCDVSAQTWCTRKNLCVPQELAVQACNTDTRRDHA
jgi:hypothetical protein